MVRVAVAEKSTFRDNVENLHSRMQQIEFEGYTFLAGPQIPQISPSNLPSPQNMLEDLLQFYIPPSIIPQLKKIPQLTLHLFAQLLIEYVDPDGQFLQYYTIGHQPNHLHYYLADQLGSGEFLCTTTYDYLLEEATKNRVHDMSTIHPVITQADYSDFAHPSEINGAKHLPIYKLRGSQLNIISGDYTIDSVGSQFNSHIHPFSTENRSKLSNYKKDLFHKLIKDKVLILTGFDDHDVHELSDILNDIPTVPAILWIQHSSNLDFIKIADLKEKENTAKHEDLVESKTLVMGEFLQQFQQNTHCEVLHLKCDLNTVNLGEILAVSKRNSSMNTSNFADLPLDSTNPSITIPFSEWITHVDPPMEYQKYKLATHLFEYFGDFSEALSCAKEGFYWENDTENPMFRALRKANFANMIGIFYRLLEDSESALDYLTQALEFTQQVDNLNSEGIILNSIGLLLMEQGNYTKAGEIFNKAFKATI